MDKKWFLNKRSWKNVCFKVISNNVIFEKNVYFKVISNNTIFIAVIIFFKKIWKMIFSQILSKTIFFYSVLFYAWKNREKCSVKQAIKKMFYKIFQSEPKIWPKVILLKLSQMIWRKLSRNRTLASNCWCFQRTIF